MEKGQRMKTLFYITKRDIALGLQWNCTACPAARAIRRRLKPSVLAVRVHGGSVEDATLEIEAGKRTLIYRLPKPVEAFIAQFDARRIGEPMPSTIRFTLNIARRFLQ